LPKNLVFADDALYEDLAIINASHEEADEPDPLDAFLDEGVLLEVIGELKSGKEGTVFCCRAHPEVWDGLVAAKVFRSSEHRSFGNQGVYREGNLILNKRDARAFKKRTSWGKRVKQGTWMVHEWEVLRTLSPAGTDVPTPIRLGENVILMEYVGTGEEAAPKLRDVQLSQGEARHCFERIIWNITEFLRLELVHGDLSPYNILHANGRTTIIDFPQAVDPRFNRNAFQLLRRDLQNVCRHFERYGIRSDADRMAQSMWRRYQRAEL